MENYLWKFYWSCGRMGDLEGLFVATEDEVKNAANKEVYFGEVLGKHSEIYGTLEEKDIEKVDLDSETVNQVKNILGYTWSGFNPIMYANKCKTCGDPNLPSNLDENELCEYCRGEGRINDKRKI
jgi:hypothetical protein